MTTMNNTYVTIKITLHHWADAQ